jgi:hypothetical protein
MSDDATPTARVQMLIRRPAAEGSRLSRGHHAARAGTRSATTALESTQGFTLVACDLKVLLESGSSADLSRDKAYLIQTNLVGGNARRSTP